MTTDQKIDKILLYIEGDSKMGIEGAVQKQQENDSRLERLEKLVDKVTSVPFLGGVFVGVSSGILILFHLIEAIKKYL